MVQHDAVQAVVNETAEQVGKLVEVWTSPETIRALKSQRSSLSLRPHGQGGRHSDE
jgi:hypothetical protein